MKFLIDNILHKSSNENGHEFGQRRKDSILYKFFLFDKLDDEVAEIIYSNQTNMVGGY